MSELRLNIIDACDAINGTVHGAVADAVIAALSAEPETIAELEGALERYKKQLDDRRPFGSFNAAENFEPWDAGLVIVDLASRIVAADSSYSALQAQGEIQYHDGSQTTDVWLPYRVPDDWLFIIREHRHLGCSLGAEYLAHRDRRRVERASSPAMDTREILYGSAMLEFIVSACVDAQVNRDYSVCVHASENPSQTRQSTLLQSSILDAQSSISLCGSAELSGFADLGGFVDLDGFANLGGFAEPSGFARNESDPQFESSQSIHSRWLMTRRGDLGGKSPREVLLEKLDFIDVDLQHRALQWSLLGEGPPPLSRDSFAYRFGGFGTHEYVVYYYLIRYLLTECLERLGNPQSEIRNPKSSGSQSSILDSQSSSSVGGLAELGDFARNANVPQSEIRNPQSLKAWLEQLKAVWLNEPQDDFDGRIPGALIESERRRIPMVMNAKQMMIDENCDVCRLMAGEKGEDFGPGFWHLDGSGMDQEFEFSTYGTREEWEAEQRSWREFNKEFDRKWAAEHVASREDINQP